MSRKRRVPQTKAPPGKSAPSSARPIVVWTLAIVLFLAGLAGRIASLDLPRYSGDSRVTESSRWHPAEFRTFLEQDEKIYLALVEQLDAGRGYTLQGHPILKERWLVGEQYGHTLFFHPPGGVALFWLAHRLAGDFGYPLVQVVSFAVFFWSLMWLGALVIRPFGAVAAGALGVLGSFTPLMAHVAGRFWLDGPVLAFSTLAAAVFVSGALRNRLWLTGLAGVILGYASLIKLTAFLVVPGVIALAWTLRPRGGLRPLAICTGVFVGAAILVQLPWEFWQWQVFGTPWPDWAGRPASRLVQGNRYIYFLTVVRTPWTYVELLPQVLWTLVASLVLWVASRRVADVGRIGVALMFWIATVVGVHMFLGTMGYSKVLRYVILITPAAALLFAQTCAAAVELARRRHFSMAGAVALLLIALAGLGLELAQGLRTSLYDNARMDMVRPLTGERGIDW